MQVKKQKLGPIYINRDTAEKAGGGGGGGRGPGSMTNLEDDDVKTFTEFVKTNEMIGMVVGQKNGDMYIKGGEITLAINEDGGTTATIQADCIDMDGVVAELDAYDIQCESITCRSESNFDGGIYTTDVSGSGLYFDTGSIDGLDCQTLEVDGQAASWQTYAARYCNVGFQHYYIYGNSAGTTTPTGAVQGRLVTSYTDATIHYLGSAST